MIGEQIDEGDDICGAVISIRPKVQRIQVWLRNKNDFDAVERIGQTLLSVLDIGEPGIVSSLVFEVGNGVTRCLFSDSADHRDFTGQPGPDRERSTSSADRQRRQIRSEAGSIPCTQL